jgi:hypothetical protein
MTLDFPILLNAPKQIPVSVEQHEKFSIIGLASFMVNYPICIADKNDHIILYCPEYKGNYYHTMPRFKEVIPGRINQSVELAYFTISKNTKLFKTIDKYFKHLYLKNDKSRS